MATINKASEEKVEESRERIVFHQKELYKLFFSCIYSLIKGLKLLLTFFSYASLHFTRKIISEWH